MKFSIEKIESLELEELRDYARKMYELILTKEKTIQDQQIRIANLTTNIARVNHDYVPYPERDED